MSLELLLTPLFAALAIFGAVVVLDARTVFLEQVDVPLPLWSSGFNSLVVQQELADAMLDVEREGRAREATRELALEAGDDAIDLVTDYFELTPLVGAFQQAGGFVAYGVDSHVTEDGDNYVLQLDITGRDGSERTARVTHPKSDIPGFIRQGAEAIMQVVEPEPLCASYLAQAIEGGGPLTRAEDCIRVSLPMASPRDQVWLSNLAGVVRFMEGDQDGAMARFKDALRLDPTFSPSLLNVGVLFSSRGQPAEALKAYGLLFSDLDDGVSDRTYAAAYAEWAKTLISVGRREQAAAVLRQAIEANPGYAQSYFELAGLLPPGAEADALRRRGEEVARTADQLYTENLIGPVYDAGIARTKPL
jgi:tetratricopeptide (TPR) repeat protein